MVATYHGSKPLLLSLLLNLQALSGIKDAFRAPEESMADLLVDWDDLERVCEPRHPWAPRLRQRLLACIIIHNGVAGAVEVPARGK
jgi:hypothetical protein